MKTPEYTQLLTSQIVKAKEFANGEEMIIYINSSDESLKETLEAKTGAKLTISNRDFIGGTRAVMQEKNILIDNSFITRFKEAKNEFVL
ncbi:MAG: V-type synthase subunit [Anaerocolumna sp.]|nr:V-type synthase subunit [Anaerocolumna sp.]